MVPSPPRTPPPTQSGARAPPNIKEGRARHVRVQRLKALVERALQESRIESTQRPAPFQRRLSFGDTKELP